MIDKIRVKGDSCGGEVTCVVRNPPIGLGSPVFDKLEAELAKAAMSLPASKVKLAHGISYMHDCKLTSNCMKQCSMGKALSWLLFILKI